MHRPIKNGEVYEAIKPLQELIKLKLPVKLGYNLARNATKFMERAKAVEETRITLVEKYGVIEDGTNKPIVKEDNPNYDKFMDELNELFDIEEDMIFQKVRLPNDLEVEVNVLMPLVKIGLIEEPC